MGIKELIYFAVQGDEGQREVFLEDFIRIGCGYRHHLHLTGEWREKAERPQESMLREVALGTRLMISKYLFDSYGDNQSPMTYTPGHYLIQDGITVLIDGFLDDVLVDIQVVSTDTYSGTRAPKNAVLSAATKAYWTGKSKALLIVIDRNTQEWSFWSVRGDLKKATEGIRQDATYVQGLETGSSIQIGMGSTTTCRICPFTDACTLEPNGDPPAHTLEGLEVVPAALERTRMENYLWGLNRLPNTRTTKVIHPSEISTKKCDRLIAYGLLGVEKHESVGPKLRRIFDVGHVTHDIIQRALGETVDGFEPEVLAQNKELRIHGHCDGAWGTKGVEIKSINDKGFSSLKKASSDHEKQATIYGAVLHLDAIHYIYVNKESADLKVYAVPINRSLWHKQAARATNIIQTVEMEDLPPPLEKDWSCKSCSYAWTCKPHLGSTVSNQNKRTF